jgi:putative aldouronate transport system permease protein
MKKRKRYTWSLLLLVLPIMLWVVLFDYVPLAGWVLSLFEYRPGLPLFENKFVGLNNFKYFLMGADVLKVVRNTLVFSAINLVAMVFPIIFALLLNEVENRPFRRVVQTVTTVPHFISWVIAYSLCFALFSTEGLVNGLLAKFGLSQNVLSSKNAVYWFQSVMTLWKGLGWSAIIYIAAIAGIDQELYEAATVDGAGRFRCAIHITLPGIMPTFLVLILLNIAGFMNTGTDQHFVFRNPYIMDTLETIDLYTYRVGLQSFDYSYATAVGILKSFISIMLLFITNFAAKKIRGENIV